MRSSFVAVSVRALRRWWWLLLGAAVAGAILTPLRLAAPPQFEATSIVTVVAEEAGAGGLQTASSSALLLGQLITLRPTLAAAIDRGATPASTDALQKLVSVRVLPATPFVEITARGGTAARAAATAQAIADAVVDGVAGFAPAVEMLQPAVADPSPLSRHVRRDVVLGGWFGFQIALVVVAVFEIAAAEGRRHARWDVIARIPRLRLPFRPVGGGVNAGLDGKTLETLRVLRTRVIGLVSAATRSVPPVVVVSGVRAGVGASSTAAALATVLALSGLRTLLIDGDPGTHAQSVRFGLPNAPGLVEALAQHTSPAAHPTAIEDLFVLSAGDSLPGAPGERDLLVRGGVRERLTVIAAGFDFVVIDVPVAERASMTAFAAAADLVLVVSRAGEFGESTVLRESATRDRVAVRTVELGGTGAATAVSV